MQVRVGRRGLLAGGLSLAGALPAARVWAQAHNDSLLPVLEISQSALAHNARAIAAHAQVPLWACVKANGFNLGEVTVARAIDANQGTAGYMVTRPAEAFALADAGVTKPILLLVPVDAQTAIEAARRGIHLAITAADTRDSVRKIAQVVGRPYTVHWDIDTGIHRQGIPWWQAAERVAALYATGALKVHGTASYFVGGKQDESPPFEIDKEQIRRFTAVTAAMRAAGVPVGIRHMVSSVSYFPYPDAYFDGVRCGGLLYGGYPLPEDRASGLLDLRQSYTLRSRVAQVMLVRKGEGIGYAQATRVESDTWVALLLIGGVDGYRPKAGKGGALIGGRWRPMASLTGTHMVVILGEQPDVGLGDEAILYGEDARIRPETVAAAGAWANYGFRPTLRRTLIA